MGADVGSDATREFTGMRDCWSKCREVHGVKGLYRGGFWLSSLGIGVYRGAYFGFYDTARAFFPDLRKANSFALFMFAQCVTITAGILAYPIDTVRARVMMQIGR